LEHLTKREVRYICFRLLQEYDGGNDAVDIPFLDEVRVHLEKEEDFDGWINFGKTWDVSEKSPLVAVRRIKSIASEWNTEVEKTAIDFPSPSIKKEVSIKGKSNTK
jgi:hypothetical protein